MPRGVDKGPGGSSQLLLAVASGALLALCFPKPDLGWLAWAALAPLFYALLAPGLGYRRGFLTGFVSGFTFFLILLYWIYLTCRAGGLAVPLAALATAALAAILALVFGAFGTVAALFSARLPRRLFAPAAASAWVALELFRERVMGFPWELLGYSQWRHPALLQITAWTGVHGLSFLIVWLNAALAVAVLEQPRSLKAALRGVALPLLAIAASVCYGLLILTRYQTPSSVLKLALLQGNVDQYIKWDSSYVGEIERNYAELAAEAGRGRPDLILWPESALPGWLEDPEIQEWASSTVRKTGVYNVIGAVTRGAHDGVLNAGVLFDPSGHSVASYAKRHLVPFGEYVPLQDVLGRWAPILTTLGGVAAGTDATPLPYPKARLGAAICYEIIMPDEVRESVRLGAALLANLTNDGWYLDTAGPYQHLSMSVLRAAENRRPLARAANTGISAVVDARGRILEQTGLGRRGLLALAVPLDTSAPLTFFTRFGEIFAYLCAAAALWALTACARKMKTA